MSLWPKVREELNTIVNRHFETPEYRQLFAVKLTPARQAIWDVHYPHYIKSRRDCWGAAAVKAPLDVKRAIWEHEKDELIYDARMGSAHLTDQQMAEAAAEANLLPGVRAALMAWMYLSTTSPCQSHYRAQEQPGDRQRRRFHGALCAQSSRRSGRHDRGSRHQHQSSHGGG